MQNFGTRPRQKNISPGREVTWLLAARREHKKSSWLPLTRQSTLKEKSRLEPAAMKKEKDSTLTAATCQKRGFLDSAWLSWAYEWTLHLNSASFYENGKCSRLKLNFSKAWPRERADHWPLIRVSFDPGCKTKSNSTENTTWHCASACLRCGTERLINFRKIACWNPRVYRARPSISQWVGSEGVTATSTLCVLRRSVEPWNIFCPYLP